MREMEIMQKTLDNNSKSTATGILYWQNITANVLHAYFHDCSNNL